MGWVNQSHIIRKFTMDKVDELINIGAMVNVIGYGLCDLLGMSEGDVMVRPALRQPVPVHPELVITAEWWEVRS